MDEVQRLRNRCMRLEKCVEDFKQYDERRKVFIQSLKDNIEKLKLDNSGLQESLDVLYESIDEAKPSISNPKVKAVYFEMIEEIKRLREENTFLRQCNENGDCTPIVKRDNRKLREENRQLKMRITELESIIEQRSLEHEN